MKKRKLSEIQGKGTLRAFAALIDPLCNITEDEETQEMYAQKHRPAQRDKRAYMLAQAYKILAKHEDDFAAIMAVCYGTTPAKYKETLTPTQALNDFADLINDEVWKTFFFPAQTNGQASTSAPENTEEQTTLPPSVDTPPQG